MEEPNMINPRTGERIDQADLVGLIAQTRALQAKQKPFIVNYNYDGHMWSVIVYALDWADAEKKVEALKLTAVVSGELDEEIPVDTVKDEEGSTTKDWRIGLTVKPKYRNDAEYYHEGIVLDVLPSGTNGIHDDQGVLKIQLDKGSNRGSVVLRGASNWMTA